MECERCDEEIVGRPFVIMTRERRFEQVCEACWEKEGGGQQRRRRFGAGESEQRRPDSPGGKV